MSETAGPRPRGPLLGAIADDFTGATDLANTLVRAGMRTVQLLGEAGMRQGVPDVDCVVVALKSRTIAPQDAVAQSLAALDWLRRAGARQIYFKYCSTFDSTDRGNIGPVADALLAALGSDFSVACPAFPENGRTIYMGHLFVGRTLLSESSMRNHPLTPMTDPDLARVLARQSTGKVGLVPYPVVRDGVDSIRETFGRLRADGCRYAILDAVEDRNLLDLGAACADMPLVTGGSGMALGLPENFRRAGLLGSGADAASLPEVGGLSAVLAGSCSAATLAQIAEMKRTRPSFALDAQALARGEDQVGAALAWAKGHIGQGPVLVYSSAPPEEVARTQQALGRERAGEILEQAMAAVAVGLVQAGVRRLVVAGGETSGAVVSALGVSALRIGPQIDPGVPWTLAMGEPALALALKSGNFGGPDFMLRALSLVR